MPSTELNIKFPHEAVRRIEILGKITGKQDPAEVISSALKIYEWVLAMQTKKAVIIVKFSDHIRDHTNAEDLELADYIKNPAVAAEYFRDYAA